MSNKFSDVHGQIADIAKNYHYHEPLPWLAYLADLAALVIRWFRDFIAALLLSLHIEADTSAIGNAMRILLQVLAVCSACLVLFLVWRRFKQLADKVGHSQASPINISQSFNSEDWVNEAMEHSKATRWKEACRALYMSCLRFFDERDILVFVATRTNFEVWYALAKYKNLAPIFRSLAGTVDASWFGTKAAQENDFLLCLSNLKDIQAEVDVINSQKSPQAAEL